MQWYASGRSRRCAARDPRGRASKAGDIMGAQLRGESAYFGRTATSGSTGF